MDFSNGDESHGTIRKKVTQLNKSKLPEKHSFFETKKFLEIPRKKIGDTLPHLSLQWFFGGMLKSRNTP